MATLVSCLGVYWRVLDIQHSENASCAFKPLRATISWAPGYRSAERCPEAPCAPYGAAPEFALPHAELFGGLARAVSLLLATMLFSSASNRIRRIEDPSLRSRLVSSCAAR